MKKTLTLLFFALCFFAAHAQNLIGNQQPIQVKIAAYGATQNALLSLPDDYYTTDNLYPLIIFLHGYGERGGTVADLSKQIKQGLPLVISRGEKIQAVNPIDGKLYKFIVVSPQHWGWTTQPDAIERILQELPNTYRIDTNRVYITGLSAGGQGVIQSVTYSQALTNKIAAIVPMSPSAPDNALLKRFTFFKESKTGAWFFSGKSDPGNYTDNARRYSDSINKYNPGASKMSLYEGGHCCWANIYTPTYREGGMNIYEWMLTHTRNEVATPPEPDPVEDYEIRIGNAQDIKKIIVLMKDGGYREYDSTDMTIPNIKVQVQ